MFVESKGKKRANAQKKIKVDKTEMLQEFGLFWVDNAESR